MFAEFKTAAKEDHALVSIDRGKFPLGVGKSLEKQIDAHHLDIIA